MGLVFDVDGFYLLYIGVLRELVEARAEQESKFQSFCILSFFLSFVFVPIIN